MLGRAFDRQQHDAFAYTAWFIHCRSVMCFFRERNQNSDIVVADFLMPGTTWEKIKNGVTEPDDYKATYIAVNKLAAHLTYTRLKYEKGGSREEQGRPSEEITNYLLALTRLFLDELPAERRAWFGGVWR